MAASSETIRVEGLRSLERAFAASDAKLKRELNGRIRQAAEPVRVDAEHLAVAGIRRMTTEWSRMRIGGIRAGAYVAPKARSVRGRNPKHRPNLATMLLGRSMLPALDRNQSEVVRRLDQFLGEIERGWALVP